MAYNKIFVDSDILLDLLLKREPFVVYSRALLNRASAGLLSLYTSTLIMANVHYLMTKNTNKAQAKEYIKFLTGLTTMLPFDPDNIQSVMNSDHVDFEDAIQFFIAEKHNCDLIISRNIKHYKKFHLPVLTAEQFLKTL